MRYFTAAEANALLPLLTPILEDLTDLYIRMHDAAQVVREFEHRALQNGHATNTRIFEPDVDLDAIRDEMKRHLDQLETMGIVLKDIEIGLVDFPSHREGREVYLCWHLGEERVAYWHGMDEGYRNRQPI